MVQMNLKFINDFQQESSFVEPLIFSVLSLTTLLLILGGIFDHWSMLWAWGSFIVLGLTCIMAHVVKTERRERATEFYLEWLDSLTPSELIACEKRLSKHPIELSIVKQKLLGTLLSNKKALPNRSALISKLKLKTN